MIPPFSYHQLWSEQHVSPAGDETAAHGIIQDTKKTEGMTDEQCPKEVKTGPYVLLFYK